MFHRIFAISAILTLKHKYKTSAFPTVPKINVTQLLARSIISKTGNMFVPLTVLHIRQTWMKILEFLLSFWHLLVSFEFCQLWNLLTDHFFTGCTATVLRFPKEFFLFQRLNFSFLLRILTYLHKCKFKKTHRGLNMPVRPFSSTTEPNASNLESSLSSWHYSVLLLSQSNTSLLGYKYYNYHRFYRSWLMISIPTFTFSTFCLPTYFRGSKCFVFRFYKQHCRSKTSKIIFHKCFTGCKSKDTFTTCFYIFAYMQLATNKALFTSHTCPFNCSHVPSLQLSNRSGPYLERWFRRIWGSCSFNQNLKYRSLPGNMHHCLRVLVRKSSTAALDFSFFASQVLFRWQNAKCTPALWYLSLFIWKLLPFFPFCMKKCREMNKFGVLGSNFFPTCLPFEV